jgi:hypothetical protein
MSERIWLVFFLMVLTSGFVSGAGEFHSADYNQNLKIDTFELTRVIQFVNTVGGYSCKQGTEDGYVHGKGDRSCSFHDSDVNKDWKISQDELDEFIFLFDCRALDSSFGHVRTGDYKIDGSGKFVRADSCDYVMQCKSGQKIGDANGDGNINSYDVLLVGKMSRGETASPFDACCLDANSDGRFTVLDINEILEISWGGKVSPGVCEEKCKGGEVWNGFKKSCVDDKYVDFDGYKREIDLEFLDRDSIKLSVDGKVKTFSDIQEGPEYTPIKFEGLEFVLTGIEYQDYLGGVQEAYVWVGKTINITEGETTKVNFGGFDYNIDILYFYGDEIRFSVNGIQYNKMSPPKKDPPYRIVMAGLDYGSDYSLITEDGLSMVVKDMKKIEVVNYPGNASVLAGRRYTFRAPRSFCTDTFCRLFEGESVGKEINGEIYEISLFSLLDSVGASFVVDGESSGEKIRYGGEGVVKGLKIGVRDLVLSDYIGSRDNYVEFSIEKSALDPEEPEDPENPVISCVDSDDGLDYNQKGIVSEYRDGNGPFTSVDVCVQKGGVQGIHLSEGYCSNGGYKKEVYDCSLDGRVCDDGACVVEDVPRSENYCGSVGVRTNGRYCSVDNVLVEQKGKEVSCENSFECGSNLCVDDKCVEKGFFQRIIDFFKRLFGG